MDKYSIIITPNAIIQINEIAIYIFQTLSNPKAASDFLNSVEEKVSKLNLLPNAYPIVDKKPWNKLGVRKILLKSFVIYYIVKNSAKQVLVIAVINGRRNRLEQLKNLVI